MLNNDFNYKDAINNNTLKGCDSGPCQSNPCCCCIGPTGPQGPTGPAGGFEPAYGTFIGFQPRTLEANTLAPLDAVLSVSPVGITFSPGSSTVTVINAGIYRITYMVVSNILTNYGLIINGIFLPNSTFSNIGGSSMTGTATVALAAGSTLGITTSGAVLRTGTNTVLDILRIN
ncbi:MAG: BclA C-terminal domain-containing protein [Sporomusa sp.]